MYKQKLKYVYSRKFIESVKVHKVFKENLISKIEGILKNGEYEMAKKA